MKLSLFRSTLLSSSLALLLLNGDAGAVASGSDTCAVLTDAESPFRKSLTSFYRLQATLTNKEEQEFDFAPLEGAFASIDSLAPWLSKCVANVDVSTVAVKLLSSPSVAKCAAELGSLDMPQTDLLDDLFTDYICPAYKDTVVPCVNDVLVKELLVPAIDGAVNDCCYDFKEVILSSFGADLATMVSSLTKLVGNAICSTKTFADTQGEQVNQTCGYLLVTAIENTTVAEETDVIESMLNAVQIPNDQVCAAVTGKNFTLTSGESAIFPAGADGSTYGVCFQAMSDLVDHVSAYPVLKTLAVAGLNGTEIKISDIFEDKSCVSASGLVLGLANEDSFLMKTIAVANDVFTVFGANEYSSGSESGEGDNDDDSSASGDSDDDSAATKKKMKKKSRTARVLREAATWFISIESDSSDEASSDGSEESDNEEGSSSESADKSGAWGPPVPSLNATTAMLNSTAEYVDEMSDDLCFHIPHGVACDYGTETLVLAYPEVASTTGAGAGASSSATFKRKVARHSKMKKLRSAENRLLHRRQ
ncbi:hypothetical protein Gpo141_00011588 [Globisporangium polare]